MCCGAFIAKYVLFFVNIVFSLAGIAIIALGSTVLVRLREIQEILPVNVIPISIIVLGCVVFLIAFLACCGAIVESRCMLIMYSICMAILATIKIYLTVVIFNFVGDLEDTINEWIINAFNNTSLRQVYHIMENMFRCCGTVGPSSYVGVLPQLPPTCCANPINNTCVESDAFRGCTVMVSDYFATFGEAIGGVLITVIVIEVVAVVLALFLSHSISRKSRNIA